MFDIHASSSYFLIFFKKQAVKLLQTKPSSLSISEYFALLRTNTVSGGRALNNTSERRHIEACEFWRKRSEAEAAKVVELQARINELTGNFNALTETNTVNHQLSKSTKVVGQAPSEEPVKKKAKTTAKKGDTGKNGNRTTNVVGRQKKLHQQVQAAVAEESVFDEVFSVFLGCMWFVSALRYLTDIYSQRQSRISFRLSVSSTLPESHT